MANKKNKKRRASGTLSPPPTEPPKKVPKVSTTTASQPSEKVPRVSTTPGSQPSKKLQRLANPLPDRNLRSSKKNTPLITTTTPMDSKRKSSGSKPNVPKSGSSDLATPTRRSGRLSGQSAPEPTPIPSSRVPKIKLTVKPPKQPALVLKPPKESAKSDKKDDDMEELDKPKVLSNAPSKEFEKEKSSGETDPNVKEKGGIKEKEGDELEIGSKGFDTTSQTKGFNNEKTANNTSSDITLDITALDSTGTPKKKSLSGEKDMEKASNNDETPKRGIEKVLVGKGEVQDTVATKRHKGKDKDQHEPTGGMASTESQDVPMDLEPAVTPVKVNPKKALEANPTVPDTVQSANKEIETTEAKSPVAGELAKDTPSIDLTAVENEDKDMATTKTPAGIMKTRTGETPTKPNKSNKRVSFPSPSKLATTDSPKNKEPEQPPVNDPMENNKDPLCRVLYAALVAKHNAWNKFKEENPGTPFRIGYDADADLDLPDIKKFMELVEEAADEERGPDNKPQSEGAAAVELWVLSMQSNHVLWTVRQQLRWGLMPSEIWWKMVGQQYRPQKGRRVKWKWVPYGSKEGESAGASAPKANSLAKGKQKPAGAIKVRFNPKKDKHLLD